MKVYNKIGRLENKEEPKSENERLKEFSKTRLMNFGKKTLSRARPNLVRSKGNLTSSACLQKPNLLEIISLLTLDKI